VSVKIDFQPEVKQIDFQPVDFQPEPRRPAININGSLPAAGPVAVGALPEAINSVINVPNAGLRSLILKALGQNRSYGADIMNPDQVPTFQSLIENRIQPVKNFVRSVAPANSNAVAALYENAVSLPDMAASPFNALLALVGGKQIEAGGEALNKNVITPGFNRLIEGPSADSMVSKAQKLTTEILQPPKADLQNAYERGDSYRPIEVATRYISKAKNYEELQNRLQQVMDAKIKERNFLIKRYNRPIGGTYTQPLEEYITEQRRSGQVPQNELNTMQEVLDREKAWLKRQRKMNTVKAEARKEMLQRQTESLLERQADGKVTDRDPARNRALDKLRKGLKEKIEISHPQIKRNNADFSALMEARNLAAGQRALAQKAVPENIFQKIVSILKNPRDIAGEVTKTAFERQKSLASKTKQVESLMSRARK
jgi:hypothetical protein